MKRYTSSQLRSRLSEVLDAAERGQPIMIERRGIRFALRVERGTRPSPRRRRALSAWMAPAVAAGQWTWEGAPGPLRFKSRLKKR
ncbi:MAG: type II toxin-antitoxin system prevent-host-death family antitoxin [Acidobacteria bacterium]|nr:type II toxin-antitoxin system prevent-host-death family antitoxin [Acidobacteriota bacterium]